VFLGEGQGMTGVVHTKRQLGVRIVFKTAQGLSFLADATCVTDTQFPNKVKDGAHLFFSGDVHFKRQRGGIAAILVAKKVQATTAKLKGGER
jgi:hypothetical protein